MKKQIGQRLRLLRDDAKFSQQYVAQQLGISDTSYQNYEYGKRDIPGDVLKKLSSLYSVTVDYILGINPPKEKNPVKEKKIGFRLVPIYGHISAGKPLEMCDFEGEASVPVEIIDRYPDAFLLEVEGESMNKILPNGSFALIDPCSTVDYDNHPYAICVNGHEATVKRVHKLANGFELVPDSTDPTYKPTIYDYGTEGTEEISVIGRVVYHVLPFTWEY